MGDLRSRAESAVRDGAARRDIAEGELITYAVNATGGAAVPDMADSGIEADLDAPVHVAWSRVMADVQFIAKSRTTETGTRYRYRGIDDVINTVGPVLRKHGVAVIPVGIQPEFSVINTTKGAAMNYCRAVARFEVRGPRGDSFVGETLGEGFDTGDKSGSKASSIALRTFYIQALAIPTNEPERDTEYGVQHELAAPARPSAAEYASEILADATSINRLQQIKAELDADPRLGHAEVEGLDGQPVELGRLVRRVGATRLQATSSKERS